MKPLCNPMRGMKGKELGFLFFWLLSYCLVTSSLKVYFMLKTPHYPFPITFNFRQDSCLTNYPAENIVDLQLSENNQRNLPL